jgi:DNA-binding CsgD family transcriptional regulator
VGDIASDYSGAARAVVKRRSIRNRGQASNRKKRADFGLLRLEKQIIALTVDGYSREEAARSIGISKPALALYLTNIYDKLHVSNQFELILFAVYHQLADSETVS